MIVFAESSTATTFVSLILFLVVFLSINLTLISLRVNVPLKEGSTYRVTRDLRTGDTLLGVTEDTVAGEELTLIV